MKIISTEATEVPITNVEVYEWLKEKDFTGEIEKQAETEKKKALENEGKENENLSYTEPQPQPQSQSQSHSLEGHDEQRKKDAGKRTLRPPMNTESIARQLNKFFETCPSALVTNASLKKLYAKLKRFNLTTPELLMISNIRPEAYAHLEPLIVDVYSRFEEQQIVDMLEIINDTLEPRTRDGVAPKWRKKKVEENENEAGETEADDDTRKEDEVMKDLQPQQEHNEGRSPSPPPPPDLPEDNATTTAQPEKPREDDEKKAVAQEAEGSETKSNEKKDEETNNEGKDVVKEDNTDKEKPGLIEGVKLTSTGQIDAMSTDVSSIVIEEEGKGSEKKETKK